MKKIGIIPNTKKDIGLRFTKKICDWLQQKDLNPIITELNLAIDGVSSYVLPSDRIRKDLDVIIVLGGDGTLLTVARSVAEAGTPLLGINFGNLGFLTDTNKLGAFESLQKYLDGDYKIDKRMMLECTVTRAGNITDSFLALNDFAILKDACSKMITYDLSINGEYIYTYRADGIVISTPTGSTAYNLSAGGPVLKPDTSMIAITPVSPHMLFARPSVVSGKDEIKLAVTSGNTMVDAWFLMDGQNVLTLKYSDTVEVKKASYYTNIVKTNNIGYYDILHQKMTNIMG